MNNNVEVVRFVEHGQSLGPRDLGKNVRESVEALLKDGKKVLFDFKGVHLISSAFADEIFGKLFVSLGEDVFKRNVKINGFDNEEDKKLILFIIQKGINYRRSSNG